MIGIVFTYFLSSISFRPLAKILKALDSANISIDTKKSLQAEKMNSELLKIV